MAAPSSLCEHAPVISSPWSAAPAHSLAYEGETTPAKLQHKIYTPIIQGAAPIAEWSMKQLLQKYSTKSTHQSFREQPQ